MSPSRLERLVSCLLLVSVPVSVLAADTASAMLYTAGSTWLNGAAVPRSSAVFNGDTVQTQSGASARIHVTGSSVLVLADSLVKFDGPEVEIEHGGVQVSTSRGFATKADDVTVSPAGHSWTEFQVAERDGRVEIVATKGDLAIQDMQGTTTLSEGQQTTRESDPQKRKHRKQDQGAAPAGKGGIMDSRTAILAGLGIIGLIELWTLTRTEEPMSPICPNNSCP